MFTGIIEETGRVINITKNSNSAKLNIDGRDVWVFSKYLKEISNN